MASCPTWKLKCFGRFTPGSGGNGTKQWRAFEAKDDKPEIVLTIVESAYLLVLQGQESLDTIPLLGGCDGVKIHQKSDKLMFRFTGTGNSRMIRMQFDGSNRAEAVKECSSAVAKLREYMPVTAEDDAPLLPNQSPAELPAPLMQTTWQENAVGVEPEAVHGSVSVRHLTQHLLGGTAVTLPQVYCHGSVAQGDLEPILRLCLLDPTFPAFVEKVEGELSKLLEE